MLPLAFCCTLEWQSIDENDAQLLYPNEAAGDDTGRSDRRGRRGNSRVDEAQVVGRQASSSSQDLLVGRQVPPVVQDAWLLLEPLVREPVHEATTSIAAGVTIAAPQHRLQDYWQAQNRERAATRPQCGSKKFSAAN